MEFFGYLSPIAFVFAIAALAKVSALEKKIDKIKKKDN